RSIRQKRADGQTDETLIRKTLFDGYGRLQLDNVQIRHIERYDQAVEVKADFAIENYAQSFSDGLQFPPMMMGYLRENPFDKNRQLPVMLGLPSSCSCPIIFSCRRAQLPLICHKTNCCGCRALFSRNSIMLMEEA